MIVALTYVGISVLVLLLLTVLYVVEDIQGKQVFMVQLRSRFDALLYVALSKLQQWISVFTTGFMRILFHYGAHSILKRLLATLRTLEGRVEHLVRQNRKVARDLRNRTRTHLDDIADHKAEVALTDTEKEKMLAHSK